MNKKITKTDKILSHLKTHGSITSLDAFKQYNATRLSSIIFNLRKRGYYIATEQIAIDGSYYAKYLFYEDLPKE